MKEEPMKTGVFYPEEREELRYTVKLLRQPEAKLRICDVINGETAGPLLPDRLVKVVAHMLEAYLHAWGAVSEGKARRKTFHVHGHAYTLSADAKTGLLYIFRDGEVVASADMGCPAGPLEEAALELLTDRLVGSSLVFD